MCESRLLEDDTERALAIELLEEQEEEAEELKQLEAANKNKNVLLPIWKRTPDPMKHHLSKKLTLRFQNKDEELEGFSYAEINRFYKSKAVPGTFPTEASSITFMNRFFFQCSSPPAYFVLEVDKQTREVVPIERKEKDLCLLLNGYNTSPFVRREFDDDGTEITKKAKPISLWKAWKNSDARRTVTEIVYRPNFPPGFHGNHVYSQCWDYFNAWTALPFLGEWQWPTPLEDRQEKQAVKVLKAIVHHGRTVLCRGNDDTWNYLRQWQSHLIQYPERQIECAIVITGIQGSGKSFYFYEFSKLFGDNAIYLTDVDDAFDRYNGSCMDNKVFVLCDEILIGKKMQSKLKNLLTAKTRRSERKYNHLQFKENLCNFIFTSNDRFCIQMEQGSNRRLMFLEGSSIKVGDLKYFEELSAMLEENGGFGYKVWSYWLAHQDLSEFKPKNPPMTQELKNVMLKNRSELQNWWQRCLNNKQHTLPLANWQVQYEEINQKPVNPHWVLGPVSKKALFTQWESFKSAQSKEHYTEDEFSLLLADFIPSMNQFYYVKTTYDTTTKEKIGEEIKVVEDEDIFRMPKYQQCLDYWNKHFNGATRTFAKNSKRKITDFFNNKTADDEEEENLNLPVKKRKNK